MDRSGVRERRAAARAPGWTSSPPRWRAALALGAIVALLAGCGSAGEPPTANDVRAEPTSSAPHRSPTPAPSPSPTGPATAAPMAASAPVRVVVPAIGVDSDLMDLGLNADGTMEVPPGAFPAGWYTGAPTPGERGPAVLAGHVDWKGEHGVFHDLAALLPGDTVTVVRADASVATFRVTDVKEYPKDEFPTAAVYGNTPGSELRLITCGGDWDAASGHYLDNVVAYAVLEPTGP